MLIGKTEIKNLFFSSFLSFVLNSAQMIELAEM